MQKLSTLLENLQRRPDHQQNKSVEVKPQDVEWERAKTAVDGLPREIEKVVRSHVDACVKKTFTNHVRITVHMGKIMNFVTQLVVYEPTGGKNLHAWYVMFNQSKNLVYQRNLTD